MKRILFFIFISTMIFSCSKSNQIGYFNTKFENYPSQKQVIQDQFLSRIESKDLKLQDRPEFLVSKAKTLSMSYVETKKVEKISRKEIKKIIKEIKPQLKEIKREAKLNQAKSGPADWEPNVKIGVTLLAVGIILSLFGIGFVGGLAAVIGLFFLILGLINSY
ncbi:MAG: hypothetical protein RIR51_98 [Bacteroidota bacterium]